MMQLATTVDGKPWCCTVYYVTDADHNLYWLSLPSRRHSQEIKANPNVAAAIAVKFVNGEKVVGIQIEGTARALDASEADESIIRDYASKFKRDDQWVENYMNGKTNHTLYKLSPGSIVLFDEVNFADNSRIVIK